MAQQNQLLFNLSVPYNPINMVTQFHNPGPVVIERLAGGKQTRQDGTRENPEEPVQFSVVSKEKLSFAMQLARRDMKNKIHEQKHQHYRQQLEERGESAKPPKKACKKKGVNQKASKSFKKPSSPDSKKSNINLHRRSVKTQTPPSKRSPLLFLQSSSQPGDEREVKGTQVVNKADSSSKSTSALRSVKLQQNQEISRLNKELKTCVERINTLSKQVSEPTAVNSSPDRTATLRAGLEALMRADPNQAKRSEVMNPRRQRKPVERRRFQNSSVILPMSMKSRHHSKEKHAPTEGSMHFTRPTKSSKSKGIAAGDVIRKVITRTSPRVEVKSAWAPPGSPQSFHKVRSFRHKMATSRVSSDVADYEEIESLVVSPGRGRTGHLGGRGLQERDEHHRHRMGDTGEKMTRARPKHEQIDRGGSYEWKSSSARVASAERARMKSQGQLKSSGDTESTSHGRYAKIDYEPREGDKSRLDEFSKETGGHKHTARRKVMFDRPVESGSSIGTIDHGHPVQSHGTSKNSLYAHRHVHTRKQNEDDGHRYTSLYDRIDSEQEIGQSEKYGSKRNLRISSDPTLKNTKDRITDLLVDEILEDAVQELERLDNDTMITRQAQIMHDTPTFENLLQELEYMEMEEERIRRRWKQVKYDDPQVSRSEGCQGSKVHEVWMRGTPLDAQQMERLSDVPGQHTAISLTNTGQPGNQGTSKICIHPVRLDNPAHDHDEKDMSSRAGQSNQPIHLEPSLPLRNGLLIPDDTARDQPLEAVGASVREGGGIPVFVPSDMMKRVQESREEFETHLKRTSHFAYGTFNPWKLVEKISDELVDDIISGITDEVGDVIGNYVETLYSTEFDVKTDDASLKEKARKALFT
eukprot:XP_003726831.1 PREDICTED: uncharacterized protein KIAA0753 isoform X2 [Strongylocentrotus purpuratus]